jgi:hypothetical protein
MPIWMFALTFSQGFDVDEIQIGYVMNDDAISYLEDIQNIYKAYQPICEPMKPLVFPLIKMKKWEMAKKLPQQYLDLIFSCENATIIGSKDAEIIQYEPCCECTPCRTIIATNYYEIGCYPDNYNKKLIKQHVHALNKKGYNISDEDGKMVNGWNALIESNEPRQLEIKFPPDLSVFKSPGISHIEYDNCNDKKEIKLERAMADFGCRKG